VNVFVLCTGRCGSTTFIRACSQITNFSAGHETRAGLIGSARLDYPPRHIEADNRLSWFLGRLERTFGDRPFYVHLTRDPRTTAESFLARFDAGIMHAYHSGILMRPDAELDRFSICLDYVETVRRNIEAFLRTKQHIGVRLERASDDFRRFWEAIAAEGDLDAALAEWSIHYNAR
jgi:hypothetical protein